MVKWRATPERYRVWARSAIGALLVLLSVLLIVNPPTGGVPVPAIVAAGIAVAGSLTILGRRYDIAVRILWAITAALFAMTLVHYNVACTSLYSGPNLAIPAEDVWLVCAPAWPLFSAPALSGALLMLLLLVRDAFGPTTMEEGELPWSAPRSTVAPTTRVGAVGDATARENHALAEKPRSARRGGRRQDVPKR